MVANHWSNNAMVTIHRSSLVPIQVPILTQTECQEKVQGNETIESSILCAGGEGSGTNKVIWEDLYKCYALLLHRGTVEDPLLWRWMAFTLWLASPATECQQLR